MGLPGLGDPLDLNRDQRSKSARLTLSLTVSQEAQAYTMAVKTPTLQPSIIQHEILFSFVEESDI
jgi:hypothetical protein